MPRSGSSTRMQALGRRDRAIEARCAALGGGRSSRAHAATHGPDWNWFEDAMTYDNARLAEALVRIGIVLGDRALPRCGLATFAFLRSGRRRKRDLRPDRQRRLVSARRPPRALRAAAAGSGVARRRRRSRRSRLTGDERYRRLRGVRSGLVLRPQFPRRRDGDRAAVATTGWKNSASIANMGAESTLAYLASAFALAQPAATPCAPSASAPRAGKPRPAASRSASRRGWPRASNNNR